MVCLRKLGILPPSERSHAPLAMSEWSPEMQASFCSVLERAEDIPGPSSLHPAPHEAYLAVQAPIHRSPGARDAVFLPPMFQSPPTCEAHSLNNTGHRQRMEGTTLSSARFRDLALPPLLRSWAGLVAVAPMTHWKSTLSRPSDSGILSN